MSATGKIQWESAATRTHHQTGEFDVALPAGGGGPGHGAQLAGVAQPVLPSDDASGTENSKSGQGPPFSHSFVLDVSRGTGLPAAEKFGSYAGQPGSGDGVQQNTE